MRAMIRLLAAVTLCASALPGFARDTTLDQKLLTIQEQWARINYQMPVAAKEDAFAKLEAQAGALATEFPDRAEPKVWEALVLSTHAGVHGGLGALPMVRQARDLLLDAETINPDALQGSIYTSLGSLYYQVPGWPIGFGDQKKGEAYLKKALALNPDGIDPNYFYGDYLFRQGQSRQALAALNKALQAKARPGRSLADEGRRQDIQALIEKIHAKEQSAG